MAKKKFARKCTACGAGMNEGYCIEGGAEYYCSDACLHTEITPAEWDELYNDGEGESYWTDWSEDPDNFDDEDESEDEVDTYHARDCSIPELTAEVERLQEKCDELGSDKERWYRMAELHCSTIDRLKTSMREAMAMLDKHEPEPAGAFAVLLLALNPELQSAKNAALRQEV